MLWNYNIHAPTHYYWNDSATFYNNSLTMCANSFETIYQLLIIIYHRNLQKCFTNSPQLTSSPYLSLLKDRGQCVLVSNMDDSLNGIVSHLPIFAHPYPVRVESTYSDIHFQFCCFIVLLFLLPRNSSRSISIWLGISLARLLCPLKTNN